MQFLKFDSRSHVVELVVMAVAWVGWGMAMLVMGVARRTPAVRMMGSEICIVLCLVLVMARF